MSSTVLTQTVARLLLAPVLVIAVAVLVKGYASTGDGFAAGAIAALGVLMQRVSFPEARAEGALGVRHAPRLALAGLAIALGVAFVPVALGEPLLTHQPAAGSEPIHLGTLEIITAVAFDVGICLLVAGAVVGIVGMLGDAAHGGRRP